MGILKFHRNIKIRIAESFLSTAISSMIFPFMAIYLANHFGKQNAGLLLLINVFVGILINFFGGYFADSFGRKKIIVFAESLRFIAFLTMMICNSPWFSSALITFFMMTINSICWGLAGPANQAMLIDVSKPEERKLMYSIMYWANNLSIAFGGILGGFMFKNYLFELFIALSITSFITWVLITFFISESYVPEKMEKKPMLVHAKTLFGNYHQVFRDRIFILYVTAGLFVLSMEFQLTSYISIRLESEMPKQTLFNWVFGGLEMTGFLRTENTILVVVLALFAAKLVQRFKDGNVLIVSCLIFVAGYSIISYTNNIWLLLIAMLFATVAEVLRVPVQQNYMANLPPDHARSSYMAINGLTYNVSMLICSITVTLSAFVPSIATTIFITCFGIIGIYIYTRILPELDTRVKKQILANEKVSS